MHDCSMFGLNNLVEKTDQFLAASWLLELSDRLGLNLPDAFSRDLENVADFLERVAVGITQTVTELDNLSLAVTEGLEDFADPSSQHLLSRADRGALGRTVREQIAKMAVFAVTTRGDPG